MLRRFCLLALLTSSCISGDDIRGKDRHAFLPVLRARLPLASSRSLVSDPKMDQRTIRKPKAEGTDRIDGTTPEGEVRDLKGDAGDLAPVAVSEAPSSRKWKELNLEFSFDAVNAQASSPVHPNIDFDMRQLSVGARGSLHFPSGLAISGLLGLGGHEIDYSATGGMSDRRGKKRRYGPLFGLELAYQANKSLSAYARTSFLVLLADSTSMQNEFGLRWALGEQTTVLAGYRTWRYRFEELSLFGGEDMSLEARGFFAGFEWRF